MFLGLGVMASTSAVFHVFTHAFFKALLFLSAGSVMHAMGGELDIRKMSGIRKVMPITAATMLVGCIALAGVPGFAGFFSKDEIIAHAINAPTSLGFFLGLVALLVAFMTAFYTFRVYFKVFLGPLQLPGSAGHHEISPFDTDTGPAIVDEHGGAHAQVGAGHGHSAHGHDDDYHAPNDGSPLMWVPLLILCIGAIGAGYLGFAKTGDWLHPFLGQALMETPEGVERISEHFLLALGFILPFAGIAVAYYFYKANRPAADAMAARFRPLVNFLYNKWYWDEIYAAFILKPIWMLALVFALFDQYIIDGVVFFISFVPQIIGYSLKPTQRGVLQRYAVGMIAGLAALIFMVMYLIHS
jgi:NADH-quinone oxidoreductase subunit L